MPLIVTAVLCRSLIAWAKGRETTADVKERIRGPRQKGPSIWVHLSSVGEANAARPAILHLSKSHSVLVTTGTTTGRDAVRSWSFANVNAGLAPLDLVSATRRFLSKNDVTALIVIENELWPNRLLTAHKRDVPVILLNARMSASTMKTWSRFPKTAERIMSQVAAVFPQDQASADRFETLGAPAAKICPPFNLKELYAPVTTPLPEIAQSFERDQTVLAAATHEGEDEIVLAGLALAQKERPNLRLILAPRHPERGPSIKAMSENAGFATTLRSDRTTTNADVFVADSLGEMDWWYRASAVAFVGGSLVPKGGHTPYEPAAYRCQIIHGPHIDNFRSGYSELSKSQSVWQVTTPEELGQAMLSALAAGPATSPFQANGSAIFEQLDLLCGAPSAN
ncbi:3-deoxy-D-manno-octulosonic acid transferase [Cognatiyoonia sediminum]|uniref:3-deoxy-D-manno-octulosonic acid transferase n=1 Tax=Cognatiyoonia sediminum TaxID=1508389 RepID=UPI00093227D3|nr:glycosyltransferase N-terminal domain-containing protein [Cognatiyoonia sediminum]